MNGDVSVLFKFKASKNDVRSLSVGYKFFPCFIPTCTKYFPLVIVNL